MNLSFWKKTSEYATAGCIITIIILSFFKKYIVDYRFHVFIFGVIILTISVFSGVIIFFLKSKRRTEKTPKENYPHDKM